MATALTDTAGQRRRIYGSFRRRNAVVAVLRILVPGVGVAVFALLAGQVLIANLAEGFSIGRISLEDDRMVVETPSYSGVAGDGSLYKVTARTAEAGLGSIDAITLNDATVVIDAADGSQTIAEAARADLDTTAQVVTVEGRTLLSTASGMDGWLDGMTLDFTRQDLVAANGVAITFPGGERLDAGALHYEGEAQRWTFDKVTLTLPSAPKAMNQ